jgi:sodium transport system permease protein
MNFKRAMTVYKKEMLEMFRDKRTIFSTIVLPFILYPILFVGVSSLMIRQTAKLEKQGASLVVADSVNNESSRIIVSRLKSIENFDYLPVLPAVQKMYNDKVIHCIISITDSLQSSGIPVYIVKLQLDKSTDRGKLINDKVGKALRDAETDLIKYRLSEFGLSTEIISAIQVKQIDTSSAQKKLGSLLGAILPYLLIMLLIAGASVVAGDLVAGEKERKTLETLLVSSAHRNEIVLGKYLTVITFALINVAVNLFSLYFSMRNIASQSGLEMAGVSFPTNGFLMLFIALIPLATFYAAVLLSISTFSRNMKETRSYEQPILLVSMILAMSSFFPAIELNNGLALIPIINISLLFKSVMMNDYKLTHLLLTIGSTLLLDIAAIIVTVKLFNNEAVLFRSRRIKDWFSLPITV